MGNAGTTGNTGLFGRGRGNLCENSQFFSPNERFFATIQFFLRYFLLYHHLLIHKHLKFRPPLIANFPPKVGKISHKLPDRTFWFFQGAFLEDDTSCVYGTNGLCAVAPSEATRPDSTDQHWNRTGTETSQSLVCVHVCACVSVKTAVFRPVFQEKDGSLTNSLSLDSNTSFFGGTSMQ